MLRMLSLLFSLSITTLLFSEEVFKKAIEKPQVTEKTAPKEEISIKPLPFEPFSGKVLANKVRLRLQADLQSPIVRELSKSEYLLILGEHNDFYKVAVPSDIKLYVFGLYIKDLCVGAHRVNVRLQPNLESPVVAQLEQPEKVEGITLSDNPKWMEITAPEKVSFYVSKEYVEKAGNADLYVTYERKKTEARKLLTSANLLAKEESSKQKEAQSFQAIRSMYEILIKDYSDFSDLSLKAKEELAKLDAPQQNLPAAQEPQDEKEIAEKVVDERIAANEKVSKENPFSKMFQAFEEELFLSWNSFHPVKTQKDFYEEQSLNSTSLSGTVEMIDLNIKNPPGDYVLKKSDGKIVAYLYSTQVDLKDSIGKTVEMQVSQRPNNCFAYPTYFVHGVK